MSSNTDILKIGSSGNSVTNVQKALMSRGFDPGQVDGNFGEKTEAAVRAFQTATGLTVNGVVDSETWELMRGVSSDKIPERKLLSCVEDAKPE